mmetsp:Transcript_9069/g.11703  ORF Transcript_9069/g.11703 Transcript_9069/m.11703 type:complete len:482 (-) Transcript_9069:148-1593(-)
MYLSISSSLLAVVAASVLTWIFQDHPPVHVHAHSSPNNHSRNGSHKQKNPTFHDIAWEATSSDGMGEASSQPPSRRNRRRRRKVTSTRPSKVSSLEIFQEAAEAKEGEHKDEANANANEGKTGEISVTNIVQEDDDDEEKEENVITVTCLTWNLAETYPADQTKHVDFLKSLRGSDLISACLQETENAKPRRQEGSRSRSIRRALIQGFGKEYVPIVMHSLGGLQLIVFANKRTMLHRLDYVSVADVACGVGNVFHNKGAIGAFIGAKGFHGDHLDGERQRKLLLVSSHLAAHASKTEDRNQNYWRILEELEEQAPPRFLHLQKKIVKSKRNGRIGQSSFSHQLLDAADCIVWGGDLNYRLDLPREFCEKQVLEILSANEGRNCDYRSLLVHDQLNRVRSAGYAFSGFQEGRISFPPTFKFDKNNNIYDSSHKMRVPSWTDRILFRFDPSLLSVQVMEYKSFRNVDQSDHRPVCATLKITL